MVYEFQLAGQRVRLWQRTGESYTHILLKALGYAMFAPRFPSLAIEQRVGLRYKPDLVARAADGRFLFWGECGMNALRKTVWLLKHAGVEQLVLFKLERNTTRLTDQLRAAIAPRYRPPHRLTLVNFVPDIVNLTAQREIAALPPDWYTQYAI